MKKEKQKKETRDVTLAQANKLTQARYNFTVVEKRAVYFIIKAVREQFIGSEGQRDLFSDLIVRIKTKDLQSTDTELRKMYEGLKNLRRKSIWIEDDERVLEVGYINYFEHTKKDEHLEVQVSHKILPHLVKLAEQFTSYSLTVAISLKTKYAQRFYEYCSQWKNKGGFYQSIDELRKKMELKDQYPRYALLKKYVLEVAQKELQETYEKGQSDLYFNYSEDRSGRTVHGLHIKVISRDNVAESFNIDDMLYHIRQWLSAWLIADQRPKNKEWIEEKMKHLILHADLIPKLFKRLNSLHGQKNINHAALARHIIEEDFSE